MNLAHEVALNTIRSSLDTQEGLAALRYIAQELERLEEMDVEIETVAPMFTAG